MLFYVNKLSTMTVTDVIKYYIFRILLTQICVTNLLKQKRCVKIHVVTNPFTSYLCSNSAAYHRKVNNSYCYDTMQRYHVGVLGKYNQIKAVSVIYYKCLYISGLGWVGCDTIWDKELFSSLCILSQLVLDI